MIELDNNATTRPDPPVVQAVTDALQDTWHNPSSAHRAGQQARRIIELARRDVAQLIGARPRDVTFTSGATESINLAIRGIIAIAPTQRRTVISTPIEHEAVRSVLEQLESDASIRIRHLPVSRAGIIDTAPLEPGAWLDESVALVSIHWANNETGTIQPVKEVARRCRDARVPLHVDGAQWVGRMPTDVSDVPIDLLSISGHKFHAPKGVGALYVRPGLGLRPQAPGAQELGRRAGTENVPGIAGMGVAARLALQWLANPHRVRTCAARRDALERAVLDRLPDARVNGPRDDRRIWTTTNIAFPGLEAEALLLALSERGVNASAGAACSSGSLDPSPVLLAMGVPEPLAHASIRLSISRNTTDEEISSAPDEIARCVERVRASAPIRSP